jgi:hypothetical protein
VLGIKIRRVKILVKITNLLLTLGFTLLFDSEIVDYSYSIQIIYKYVSFQGTRQYRHE